MTISQSEAQQLIPILARELERKGGDKAFAMRILARIDHGPKQTGHPWIDKVAAHMGVSIDRVMNGCRRIPAPEVRQVAAYFMHKDGMSPDEVADALGVDRCMFYYYMNNCWDTAHVKKIIGEITAK